MITGSSCTTPTHRSNLACDSSPLTGETIDFIKECKPSNEIKRNLAEVQAGAEVNRRLNSRDNPKIEREMGFMKYVIAAAAIVAGWWLAVKIFLGGLL